MAYQRLFLIVFAAFLVFFISGCNKTTENLEIKATKFLSGDHRSVKNKARDQYRHPVETLKFFGVTPSSKVLEISPGRGWYTEVLAPIFRDSGEFYVATWDIDNLPERIQPYLQKIDQGYRSMLSARPDIYDQVKITTYSSQNPKFLSPQSVDFILTFRNVHNWALRGNADQMFAAFFETLKPGGILGVTDHRAKPGTPFDKQTKSGYMTESYVIDLAKKSGFEFVAQSEVNANPKDSADHPGGVWNLPPTLRNVADDEREKYSKIGESDRMTLKFRKP